MAPSYVKFPGGPPMIAATQNGSIDLASVGSVAFVIGLSQGLDWVMIGINPEGAYSQGLVVAQGQRHPDARRLQGQAIGLFNGTTAQFGLMMILRQHGIRLEQVTMVNMPPEAQLHALEARRSMPRWCGSRGCSGWSGAPRRRIIETEGNLGIYTNVDCYTVRREWLRATAKRRCASCGRWWSRTTSSARIAGSPIIRGRAKSGSANASAEAIFDVVPPPLIYEWTNPRYTYSLVKGGPLYQRLGFLAAYMARYGIIPQPVELDDAMDMSLIAEVLKGRKPPVI